MVNNLIRDGIIAAFRFGSKSWAIHPEALHSPTVKNRRKPGRPKKMKKPTG